MAGREDAGEAAADDMLDGDGSRGRCTVPSVEVRGEGGTAQQELRWR